MRNIAKRTAEAPELVNPVVASIPGGTSGQPDDPNPRQTFMAGDPQITPARDPLTEDRSVQGKRYRVVGTTGKTCPYTGNPLVVYNGMTNRLMLGREVSETSCDLDALRRQGVKLEEVHSP